METNFKLGDKLTISFRIEEGSNHELIQILLAVEKLKQQLLEDLIIKIQNN